LRSIGSLLRPTLAAQKAPRGISRRITGQPLTPPSVSVSVIAFSTLVSRSIPGSQGPLGSYLPNHMYSNRAAEHVPLSVPCSLLKDVSGTDRAFEPVPGTYAPGPNPKAFKINV
jgi:hypothetical protein